MSPATLKWTRGPFTPVIKIYFVGYKVHVDAYGSEWGDSEAIPYLLLHKNKVCRHLYRAVSRELYMLVPGLGAAFKT